jgi:hypothetical protein
MSCGLSQARSGLSNGTETGHLDRSWSAASIAALKSGADPGDKWEPSEHALACPVEENIHHFNSLTQYRRLPSK